MPPWETRKPTPTASAWETEFLGTDGNQGKTEISIRKLRTTVSKNSERSFSKCSVTLRHGGKYSS